MKFSKQRTVNRVVLIDVDRIVRSPYQPRRQFEPRAMQELSLIHIYREKRERTLEQLAQKLAAGVLRYGRPSTLEPMNPYERRIIHSTVARIEGVTSSSTGEEPNRRVVISPINPRPLQGGGRGGRGGRGRAGANRTARRDERVPRDGEHSEQRSERAPRRERGPRRDDRATRGETVKPTSTEVDRAYAAELEREGALERPAQPLSLIHI